MRVMLKEEGGGGGRDDGWRTFMNVRPPVKILSGFSLLNQPPVTVAPIGISPK